ANLYCLRTDIATLDLHWDFVLVPGCGDLKITKLSDEFGQYILDLKCGSCLRERHTTHIYWPNFAVGMPSLMTWQGVSHALFNLWQKEMHCASRPDDDPARIQESLTRSRSQKSCRRISWVAGTTPSLRWLLIPCTKAREGRKARINGRVVTPEIPRKLAAYNSIRCVSWTAATPFSCLPLNPFRPMPSYRFGDTSGRWALQRRLLSAMTGAEYCRPCKPFFPVRPLKKSSQE